MDIREIEQLREIEQWEGQNVVDCDRKKIGKVEDVYLATDSSEAVFAYVKTGMLGRRHCLVPLAGASLSDDLIRVAYQHDHVKGAPHFEPRATLDSGMEQDLARHYDIDLTASPIGDAPRYESARARKQLEAQAREMTKKLGEVAELSAALQLLRDDLRQADDAHQEAHKPQDAPRRQQQPQTP